MDASVVYKVAKALPMEEQEKLLNMLKDDVSKRYSVKKKRSSTPELTISEGLSYLMNNHFNKNKN